MKVSDVRTIALGFPEAREKPFDGTPGFYVRRNLFAHVLDDDQVAVYVAFDRRDAFLEEEPEVFRVTPRYMTEPFVIVRLGAIERKRLDEVLFEAWKRCAPPGLSRHMTRS